MSENQKIKNASEHKPAFSSTKSTTHENLPALSEDFDSNPLSRAAVQAMLATKQQYAPPNISSRKRMPVSPEESAMRIAGTSNSTPSVGLESHLFASNTAAGAPDINELARALQNDPQLIYQFVHDNIEWEPGYGSDRGALGCLLDGMGNACDQSSLLIALLAAASVTNTTITNPNWVNGIIEITPAQCANWFNTASLSAATAYCVQANIPNGTNSGNLTMSHVWVQVTISGTTYVMDPSFKNYSRSATIYITTASTVTVGDVLTVVVKNPFLSGGLRSFNHSVTSGETLNTIATSFANAINADSALSALGIKASSSVAPAPAKIVVSSTGVKNLLTDTPVNQVVCTASTSVGATEVFTITPIADLAAVMEYDQPTFFSNTSGAESGPNFATDGTFVQNMNKASVRSQLQTFSQKLTAWIQNHCPDASVDQILGGQEIVPVTLPIPWGVTLPYPSTTILHVWPSIPPEFRTSIKLEFFKLAAPAGFVTMLDTSSPVAYTDTLAGSRLTLSFAAVGGGFVPQLMLNGVAVGSPGPNVSALTNNTMRWSISHAATGDSPPPHDMLNIYPEGFYLIGTAMGNMGRGQLDFHAQQVAVSTAAGGAATSEPIMGEQLSVMWFNWASMVSRSTDLINRITGCKSMYDHIFGMLGVYYVSSSQYFFANMAFVEAHSTNLTSGVAPNPANDYTIFSHNSAIEGTTCAQTIGIAPGVCSVSVLDSAMSTAVVTIGGSAATLNDIEMITVSDPALSGGAKSIQHKNIFGDDFNSIATALTTAINADSDLAAIGIKAKNLDATVTIYSTSVNQTSYSGTVTGPGAVTETVSIAYQRLYAAKPSNWPVGNSDNYGPVIGGVHQGISGILTAAGYTIDEITLIGTKISTDGPVLVGDNPNANFNGAWTGYGFESFSENLALAWVNGVFKGAVGNKSGTPIFVIPKREPPPFEIGDPVDPVGGSFNYTKTDISVGSQGFPYGLDFSRSYSSGNQYTNGPLGRGWSHNHAMSASVGSDALLAMGSGFALQAVSAIVGTYVVADLFADTTYPVAKLAAVAVVDKWWMDQLINNTVVLAAPGGSFVCLKQPDGSYTTPGSFPGTLTLASGQYSFKTPQGVQYNYNSAGQLSTIVYPYGVTVTYTYNGSGQLSTISNGMGRTLTLNYTGSKLTSVTDGTGRSISYSFDGSSNLTQMLDQNSKAYTFSYDQPGRLTQIFKPQNPTTAIVTNVYDSLSRVKTQSDARGKSATYYFAGSRTQMADSISPVPNITVWYFNNAGNVTRFIDPLSAETKYTYDGLNRLVNRTMPEGNQVRYSYDANSNVLSTVWLPKPSSSLPNKVNTYTYDATWAKVHTMTDALNQTTTCSYDIQGNLASVVLPSVGGLNPTTSYTSYNSRGQLLTANDPTGLVTQFTYDTVGNTEKLLSIVVDPANKAITTTFGYDSVGNVTSVTNPNGNQTTMQYDSLRRLTQATAPAPFSYLTTYTYDDNSNVLTVQRQTGSTPAWQTFTNTYSVTDKVLTATDPSNSATVFTYDDRDRLATSTDALGHQYQFAYDALDRLYQVKDPTLTVSSAKTFSVNGYVKSVTDANSHQTRYDYDDFDRPLQTTFADGSLTKVLSYDGNGNVLQIQTRSLGTITNTYDSLNRLSTKTMSGLTAATYQVSYTYDLAGRLTQQTKGTSGPSVSDPSLGSLSFSFDTAGRFYQETYPDGKTVTHVLDANGNQTKTTWPDGYYINRTFDELDRFTGIKLFGSSTYAVQFTYNQLSQRTRMDFSNGSSVTYAPEISGDLGSIRHNFVGSSVTFAYGFDTIHELAQQRVTDNAFAYHPSAAGTTAYTMSGSGATINQYSTVGGASYSYNTNGCLIGDGTLTYAYDYGVANPTENLLTSVSSGSTVLASFVYDPLHRQSMKTVASGSTRYVYSGWQRIADYSHSGSTETLQNYYIYGPGLDEPLIQVSSSYVPTFLHHDRMGSIVAVSNASGAVINKNTYGPFGEPGASSGTSFGFTGQRFDPETGLYYYKNRYYSPKIGRFMQPDPIGYQGGDLNLYAYVKNSPQVLTDPLGLWPAEGAPAGKKGGQGLPPPWASSPPTPPATPDPYYRPQLLPKEGADNSTLLPSPTFGPDGATPGGSGQVEPWLKILGAMYPYLDAATKLALLYLLGLALYSLGRGLAYANEQISAAIWQIMMRLGFGVSAGAGALAGAGAKGVGEAAAGGVGEAEAVETGLEEAIDQTLADQLRQGQMDQFLKGDIGGTIQWLEKIFNGGSKM